MKTEYKHIYFIKAEDDIGTEPETWWCYHNDSTICLGAVKWGKEWGKEQYCFHSEHGSFFSISCLDDIGHFSKQLRKTKERE